MKKSIIMLVVLAVLAQSSLLAQDWLVIRVEQNEQGQSPVSVTGTLKVSHGEISLLTGNIVYYVPVLEIFVSFIDGLTDGSEVTLEGYHRQNLYFEPTLLTHGGKTYEFPNLKLAYNEAQVSR
ncbi:MAG: hypothetical protein Ta2A_06660 [Treponemataceae bacterium]|nr:MAG: hypothetical protein Ta2A_06660 [Treponemataceae bacterium]